jgi:hypothetical protein
LHIALSAEIGGTTLQHISEHRVFLSEVAMQHGAVRRVPLLLLVLLDAASWNVAIHSVFESNSSRLLVVRNSRAYAAPAIDA